MYSSDVSVGTVASLGWVIVCIMLILSSLDALGTLHQCPYICAEAQGVTNPDFTKDQKTRSHELAADSEAKAQDAIVPGENGMTNAKRRFQAIHKRRKETEAVFAANRKKSSIVK
jgi:hypothetical protein